MASGTADLQRDLGGAIMQSILGALLTAGFATAVSKAIASAPNKARSRAASQNALTKSFSSAEAVAKQYPHYASAIIAAARVLVRVRRGLGLRRGDHRDRARRRR